VFLDGTLPTFIVSQPVSEMWHFSYHGDTKARIFTEFLKDSMQDGGLLKNVLNNACTIYEKN